MIYQFLYLYLLCLKVHRGRHLLAPLMIQISLSRGSHHLCGSGPCRRCTRGRDHSSRMICSRDVGFLSRFR
jgi:hypothetical protein